MSNNFGVTIKSKGITKKFFFIFNDVESEWGSKEMYTTFLLLNLDRRTSPMFFQSEVGVLFLDKFMKGVLPFVSLKKTDNVDEFINPFSRVLVIIRDYLTDELLRSSGRPEVKKMILSLKTGLIEKIDKQRRTITDTRLVDLLDQFALSIVIEEDISVSSFITVDLSTDSASSAQDYILSKYTLSGKYNRTQMTSMRPCGAEGFKVIRDFLSNFVGDNTKTNNKSGDELIRMRHDLDQIIAYIKKFLISQYIEKNEKDIEVEKEEQITSFNVNKMDSVNKFLSAFLHNPELMILLLKTFKMDKKYFNFITSEEIDRLWSIFEGSCYFTWDKKCKTYIGGIGGHSKTESTIHKFSKVDESSSSDSSDDESSSSDSSDDSSDDESEVVTTKNTSKFFHGDDDSDSEDDESKPLVTTIEDEDEEEIENENIEISLEKSGKQEIIFIKGYGNNLSSKEQRIKVCRNFLDVISKDLRTGGTVKEIVEDSVKTGKYIIQINSNVVKLIYNYFIRVLKYNKHCIKIFDINGNSIEFSSEEDEEKNNNIEISFQRSGKQKITIIKGYGDNLSTQQERLKVCRDLRNFLTKDLRTGGTVKEIVEDSVENGKYVIHINSDNMKSIYNYFIDILNYSKDNVKLIGAGSDRIRNVKSYKKEKKEERKISKYVKEDIAKDECVYDELVNIDISYIKKLMEFLKDKEVTDDEVDVSKNFIEIKNNQFGIVKTGFTADWWQEDFRSEVDKGNSVILVGDTSGGKTFISIMAINDLLNKEGSNDKIIYLAPTSQLVVSQYANILKINPHKHESLGICCKSIIDIPSEDNCRIIFGTPTFVKRYLYRNFFSKGSAITRSNVEDRISASFADEFVESCNILFIDEVQTMSETYVQTQEVEQRMECKAIEEVMKCIKAKSALCKPQIVSISATLSDHSIENLKRKIMINAKIPEILDIRYSHDDIGYSKIDKDNGKPHQSIMKKPLIKAIKLDGHSISSYRHDDEIIEQRLDNIVIEKIIRDAKNNNVFPLSFYADSELSTIKMFKDFLSYLKRSCQECVYWNSFREIYMKDIENNGESICRRDSPIYNKWLVKLQTEITRVMNDPIISNPVLRNNEFELLLGKYGVTDLSTVCYSAELYGLIYEYLTIKSGEYGFKDDIHPYYKFGGNYGGDFFNTEKHDSPFLKMLIAQDANPTNDNRNIGVLIMEGIKYGITIITSSIPLPYQLEIFKFMNLRSSLHGDKNPIPILFSEYGMSMGVNFSTMSGCIVRTSLTDIGPSEFKQIRGRPGRRGNANSANPIIYTFNIRNTYLIDDLETLTFNLSNSTSSFFQNDQLFTVLCSIKAKYDRHRTEINESNFTNVSEIISGYIFKEIGDENMLLLRKLQLVKIQLVELYEKSKNLFPSFADEILLDLFYYIQKAEFIQLRVQYA